MTHFQDGHFVFGFGKEIVQEAPVQPKVFHEQNNGQKDNDKAGIKSQPRIAPRRAIVIVQVHRKVVDGAIVAKIVIVNIVAAFVGKSKTAPAAKATTKASRRQTNGRQNGHVQQNKGEQYGQQQTHATPVDVVVAVIAVVAIALGAVPHQFARKVLVRAALPTHVLVTGGANDVVATGGFLEGGLAVRTGFGVLAEGLFCGDPLLVGLVG